MLSNRILGLWVLIALDKSWLLNNDCTNQPNIPYNCIFLYTHYTKYTYLCVYTQFEFTLTCIGCPSDKTQDSFNFLKGQKYHHIPPASLQGCPHFFSLSVWLCNKRKKKIFKRMYQYPIYCRGGQSHIAVTDNQPIDLKLFFWIRAFHYLFQIAQKTGFISPLRCYQMWDMCMCSMPSIPILWFSLRWCYDPWWLGVEGYQYLKAPLCFYDCVSVWPRSRFVAVAPRSRERFVWGPCSLRAVSIVSTKVILHFSLVFICISFWLFVFNFSLVLIRF